MLLIVSHFTKNKGTTDFFIDYLQNKNRSFFVLKHPFSRSDFLNSELYFYNGHVVTLVSKYKKYRFSFLNLMHDFLVSFYVSFILGGKIDSVIGFGSFNAVPFVLTNPFIKRSVFFWGVDYSRKRFDNAFLNRIYYWFETIACKYTAHTISQSKRQEVARIQFHGLKKEKSILSSNGIDPTTFPKDFSIYNNIGFIYIGSITRQHGILEFIDYFYLKHHINIPLTIIGGGECDNELKAIIAKNKLYNIHFEGYKDQSEIKAFLIKQELRLFGLAPYQDTMEGHVYYSDSLKVKEYLNYNIPFIASSIISIPESLSTFGITFPSYEGMFEIMKSGKLTNFKFDISKKNANLKNYEWGTIFQTFDALLNKKTRIHHIELSHMSPHMSGGEKALIEIVKFISKHEDIIQVIYTSESGKEVYTKLLGDASIAIEFVVIGSKWIENIHEYVAYYIRVLQQFFYLRRFSRNEKNIIFSHEEFLQTALFSYLSKKINPTAKWIAFFHMKSPEIMKGFEGEYTNRKQFPSLRIIRYKLEQYIFFTLTKRNVARIITVNPIYEQFLKSIYKNPYTIKIFGGEHIHTIAHYSGINVDDSAFDQEKTYDLSFMARFHEQKGVFEVIDILKRLKAVKPNISIVMIGGGVKRIEDKFFKKVKEENLENNIDFKGFVKGDEKYSILAKSKIFLFPSYYESFGQVALEAMKCGLPVVSYDLPPFVVFKKGMVKVPILNNGKMAAEILKLLDNGKYWNQIHEDALSFSSDFTWDKTGEEIYSLIVE